MSRGTIRLLLGLMASALASGDHATVSHMAAQKDAIILNGNGPMPGRLPNQRQRRKRWRQVPQTRRK